MATDVPSDWTVGPLGDFADIAGGGTPSTKVAENFDGDIPWVTPKDLSGWTKRTIERGARNLSDSGLAASGARLHPVGTVLVSSRAPIGYVAIAAQPLATNQGFRSLLLRDGHSPEFFFYLMRTKTPELQAAASGTTFPEISGSALKLIRVAVPPPTEQEAIAEVLTTLDDKIQLNLVIADLARTLVETLFRSWVIDFDPVRARSDGRLPEGLDDHTASMFPSGWAQGAPGQLPDGWSIVPLSGLGRFVNGGAFTKGASGSGRAVVRIAEMKSGLGPSTVYSDRDVSDDQVVRHGDLLFAWSGSLCVERWVLPEAIVNQHIFKCIPNDGVPDWFLEGFLNAALPEFIAIAADKATTMGHIRRGDLDIPQCAVPPPDLLKALDAIVRPFVDMRLHALAENTVLAKARDALLPKLMSGALRVRDEEP